MKQLNILSLSAALLIFTASCNNGNTSEQTGGEPTETSADATTTQTGEEPAKQEEDTDKQDDRPTVFNTDGIPESTADLGEFPYFSAPKSYKFTEEKNKDYEEKYFFYNKNDVTAIAGRYFHTQIFAEPDVDFSETYVLRNYQQAIEKAGGVEVYSGYVPFKATNLITTEQPSFAKDMYDYQSTQYKQYIIKTPEGNIWVELNYGNNANLVDLTVVAEEALDETVSLTKADTP